MKIILDDKEIVMNNINDKSFSLVLEEVSDLLEKDGRMLYDIYIDGKDMAYYEYFSKAQIGTVEFVSKSPRIIILESLGEISDFISKYFDSLMAIANNFNNNNIPEGIQILLEIESGLEWIYNVLESIKENTAIDFKYPEFNTLLVEYKVILEKIEECQNNDDYIGALTFLEIDLSGILITVQENLEIYMKDIIDEEINEYKYN